MIESYPKLRLREGEVYRIDGEFCVLEARGGQAVVVLPRTLDGDVPLPLDDAAALKAATQRLRRRIDAKRKAGDNAG